MSSTFFLSTGLSDFNSIFIQKMKMDKDKKDKDETCPAWIQWFILATMSSPIT